MLVPDLRWSWGKFAHWERASNFVSQAEPGQLACDKMRSNFGEISAEPGRAPLFKEGVDRRRRRTGSRANLAGVWPNLSSAGLEGCAALRCDALRCAAMAMSRD
jgi:hypothetical protein